MVGPAIEAVQMNLPVADALCAAMKVPRATPATFDLEPLGIGGVDTSTPTAHTATFLPLGLTQRASACKRPHGCTPRDMGDVQCDIQTELNGDVSHPVLHVRKCWQRSD